MNRDLFGLEEVKTAESEECVNQDEVKSQIHSVLFLFCFVFSSPGISVSSLILLSGHVLCTAQHLGTDFPILNISKRSISLLADVCRR